MLRINYLVKIFFSFGIFSGLLSIITYAIQNYADLNYGDFLFILFLAPFVQAILGAILVLLGYPFYKMLVKNGYLVLDLERDVDKDEIPAASE